MKKIIFAAVLLISNSPVRAQEKVVLSHAVSMSDFIEISLELENKPNDYFHLISIDTISTLTDNGERLTENRDVDNIFRRANTLVRYQIPDKKFKYLHIKGSINYFNAIHDNKSYSDLGVLKNLAKNTNLIDQTIDQKNSGSYFSLLDADAVKKVFPDLKYNQSSKNNQQKFDFQEFDLIYAYNTGTNKAIFAIVNGEIEFGYHTLTLADKSTGIIYKLVQLKRGMTRSEKDQIKISLLLINDRSIKKIPFEFQKVTIKE
ncbi:hypothetical protein [Chryseobacterium gregarium]|uniref:hypothetical protein n=1 Tax=Chryseobacterium gregarium TaxID=456299 RepID=UPI0004071A0B|nr:hypothetical protein [Chryseobacterium gregarium]